MESEDRYATTEEVSLAIEELTDADFLRLRKAARAKLGGSVFKHSDELLNAAFLTAYDAAAGQGGRRWPLDVKFMAYLIRTMQGIASDSRGSSQQRNTVSLDEDVISKRVDAQVGIDDQMIQDNEEEDREQRAGGILRRIDKFFEGDEEVQWVILGIRESQSASQIQELAGLTKTQYESAQRRWRRGHEKLFSERSAQ